jgi:hypothetical protein
MSRYAQDDDLLGIVRRISRRVANLEKANLLNYGTIDEGGLIVKSGGSISVYNELDELNTFIGEGRVDFADAGEISGTIGEYIGQFYNNAIDQWVTATMRGFALFRPGQGNPYFTVAQAIGSGLLECTFGYDGQEFEHFGIKSQGIFLRGANAQDSSFQLQDDGDVSIHGGEGALFHMESGPTNGLGERANIQIQSDGDIWIGALALHTTWMRGGSVDIAVTSDFDVDANSISLDPVGDLSFFIGTTTNPANMNMTSNNVRQVSSARKYKSDIQDAIIEPEDVLKLRPRTWIDKGDLTRYENYKAARSLAKSNGEEEFLGLPIAPPDRTIGFVAEEVAEHPSLRVFVQYNEDGEPESLYYDRMSAAFVKLAQENSKRIATLEAEKTELKKRLDTMESLFAKRLDNLEKKSK